jgi:hypothetical protein
MVVKHPQSADLWMVMGSTLPYPCPISEIQNVTIFFILTGTSPYNNINYGPFLHINFMNSSNIFSSSTFIITTSQDNFIPMDIDGPPSSTAMHIDSPLPLSDEMEDIKMTYQYQTKVTTVERFVDKDIVMTDTWK